MFSVPARGPECRAARQVQSHPCRAHRPKSDMLPAQKAPPSKESAGRLWSRRTLAGGCSVKLDFKQAHVLPVSIAARQCLFPGHTGIVWLTTLKKHVTARFKPGRFVAVRSEERRVGTGGRSVHA